MKKTKKYIILSLATCITLSPIAVKADNGSDGKEIISISAPIDKVDQIEDVVMADYIKYEGKITEVNNNGKYLSILVKNDESDPYNGMVFHINEEVILLNDKTKDFITSDTLKKGMTVSGYYDKNTIMTMSLPPQLTPDVIVVKEAEEPGTIHVSKFNEDLISSDGTLKLNVDAETVRIDRNGNQLEKGAIGGKDLIVFYTISTKSIPAQTTPEKIIVMGEDEEVKVEPEITVLDKLIVNEKEITLNKSLYKNEKDVMMIPLRDIAEALEYEIKWNNESKTAELTKGAQWTAITIGEDNYNFAKMLIKLGTAPEVKDSSTYVPFSFLEEVLKVRVEITEKGMIEIGL
ncbi:copper amine oxidase N-terminal domain-containing protein [Tissierella carlieri]|uniref:Copper amine oxidase N-terminal domain-containing protein n=1 Tax=Tissierella carlieri TaxID=689904 RepID=A0ABT1S7H1_9FIRM|nr:stalk domain-containing protein [Tissierella carlieri]MCQ4922422.1 copper amine oxidase N-terminal domain-containing protein [Tissierella carlieri]